MEIQQSPGGIKERTNTLTDHISDLAESYYQLGVLNITEKATGIASSTIIVSVISFLSLFALLFLGLGFGWWLGQQLNNMLAGFCVVAGMFIILIALIIGFRKQLIFPFIRNTIIKKVYD
jgi:hypothetical protein